MLGLGFRVEGLGSRVLRVKVYFGFRVYSGSKGASGGGLGVSGTKLKRQFPYPRALGAELVRQQGQQFCASAAV